MKQRDLCEGGRIISTSITLDDNVTQKTFDSNIKKMEEKITKQNSKIETYKKQLQDKFSNMELVISQMQQNYSSFLA